MGGDADLVRRLPIESVGTIVDEVGPCEKMGPSKKYPHLKKKWGPLKKWGGGLKDAVRRYATPITGSIYSMVTIEKTHGFVCAVIYLHNHLAKAKAAIIQNDVPIISASIRLHLLLCCFCC